MVRIVNETIANCRSIVTPDWFWPVMILAMVWTLFWKGLGMWHAARRKDGVWFIILLLVNSLGILDIIYLFFFAKVKSDKLFKA